MDEELFDEFLYTNRIFDRIIKKYHILLFLHSMISDVKWR